MMSDDHSQGSLLELPLIDEDSSPSDEGLLVDGNTPPPLSSSLCDRETERGVAVSVVELELTPEEVDGRGGGVEEEGEEGGESGVEMFEEGAEMMWSILQPVMLTMVLVIAMVKTVLEQTPETISAVMEYSESSGDSETTRFFGSLLNAVTFVGLILVMTCIFVALFYFRCMRILYGWLLLSSVTIFFLVASGMMYLIMSEGNWTLDYLSFAFAIWNFAIVGLVAVFWHAPAMVTQGYMVVTSVLMAVTFSRLPEYTTWWLLAAIAIYDIFAVLCPKGPLNILVNLSQERNEEIPALLYSTAAFLMMASTSSSSSSSNPSSDNDEDHVETSDLVDRSPSMMPSETNLDGADYDGSIAPPSSSPASPSSSSSQHPGDTGASPFGERRSIKLGLGDFVFYSVLVGRAALYDIVTVFTSFVGIVIGLVFTLLCLAIFRRALPALPFSIALGILFYFLTKWCLLPMVLFLGANSVML